MSCRLEDLRMEYDEFRDNSDDLEAELDRALDQTENKNKELMVKLQRVEEENESLKVSGNLHTHAWLLLRVRKHTW